MNSGKTTALLQVAHNYEERGMNTLILKPQIDTKGQDKLVSRIGIERKVDVSVDTEINLAQTVSQWSKDVEKVSCVLVDESQFLTSGQVDQLLELTTKYEIPVICYGIRTDFQTNLFPGSERLFAVAHTIEELKTICRCGKKAIFNARKNDDKFVSEGSQVAIDGAGTTTYESLCPSCYASMVSK